jgi:hypothetical protein
MGTPGPREPLPGGRRPADLASNPGVITSTRPDREALYNQAFVAGAGGDFDGAVRLFEESLDLFRRAGDRLRLGDARWEDRYEDAVRLAGAAASLRERVGGRAPLDFLAGFLGDPEAEARAQLPERLPSGPSRRAGP